MQLKDKILSYRKELIQQTLDICYNQGDTPYAKIFVNNPLTPEETLVQGVPEDLVHNGILLLNLAVTAVKSITYTEDNEYMVIDLSLKGNPTQLYVYIGCVFDISVLIDRETLLPVSTFEPFYLEKEEPVETEEQVKEGEKKPNHLKLVH